MTATSTRAYSPVRSTLDDDARDVLATHLQPVLRDLVDLSLVGKQAHWAVVGPQFRTVHLHLDELIIQWRLWSDSVAERMSTVGIVPDGRPERIVEDARFEALPDGWIKDRDVVEIFSSRLEAVGRAVREHMPPVEDVDQVSADLLTEILTGIEEQLWMVSAQLG